MLIIEIFIVFGKDLIQLYEAETAVTLVKNVACVDAASSIPLTTSNVSQVFSSLLWITFDANDVESVD